MKKFSVYVGGLEVNDYYMTQAQAENLASQYDDYDDVAIILSDESLIENIENNEYEFYENGELA